MICLFIFNQQRTKRKDFNQKLAKSEEILSRLQVF